MIYKFLEIRDAGTFIPVIAIQMSSDDPVERYYFRRLSWPLDGSHIVLLRLSDCKATNYAHDWRALVGDSHTMPIAHQYITEHFRELTSGDVVDVETILDTTRPPKVPERLGRRSANCEG